MVIRRGEIWWALLREPRGSEPGHRRPVLVISSDDFNRSKIKTVSVVILTSNLRLADAPGNLLLKAKATRLPRDSVANVSQLVTVDKQFLTKRVASLTPNQMREVDKGLLRALGL